MKRRRLLQSSAAVIGALPAAPVTEGTAHAAGVGSADSEGGDALRVHIVTYDGVEELDVFGLFEVLSPAARAYPVTVKLGLFQDFREAGHASVRQ
ncbi:hypothetical protein ABZU45_26675 [Streptomyces avermitilis]|uniref:hypothetical protein n=1 Tax=Streptomyces avermitilis TaxID=33903 RepID=UPI0033B90C4C